MITGPNFGAAINNYFATGATGVPGVTVIPDVADPAAPGALARPAEFIGEYINANSLKTDGVDIDLQGHWDFGNGIHYTSELQGTDNLSSGAGTPRTKGSWSNTVQYGPMTVTGTLYYTSGYSETAEDVGVGPGSCLAFNAAGTAFLPSNCYISSFTEFDLTGSYAINSHVSITASIMNALDRKPPFDPANYAGVNYNPTYSYGGIVGRFYNVGVKVKF